MHRPLLTARRLVSLLRELSSDPQGLHVEPHPQSGRNRLFLIGESRDRPDWFAKQVLGSSNAEPWFYTTVAPWIGFAPTCVVARPRENVVVLDYVHGVPLHEIGVLDPDRALILLSQLAAPMARLHAQRPQGSEVPAAEIPLPALDPVDAYLLASCSPAVVDLVRRIQKRRRLRVALRDALAGPGPHGFIHGDLKLDNILWRRAVEADLSEPATQTDIVVVDWELCGVGPLGWDIGCIVGAMVLLWAQNLAVNNSTDPDNWIEAGKVPFARLYKTVRVLVRTYLEGARALGVTAPNRNTVATFAVAWLVGRVLVEASQLYGLSAGHSLLLIIAEGLVADPFELFGDLSW